MKHYFPDIAIHQVICLVNDLVPIWNSYALFKILIVIELVVKSLELLLTG